VQCILSSRRSWDEEIEAFHETLHVAYFASDAINNILMIVMIMSMVHNLTVSIRSRGLVGGEERERYLSTLL
jgi:hypothetical protein